MYNEKSITKNDMRFFQNDLLTDLKKLELQINSKVSNVNQTLSTKINEYDSKINKIFENINELISQITERKFDHERVEELISMNNKFGEQIKENQSRISIIDKNLEDSIFKYDKIILDNLQVPGIIGISCKFKNCRMFFETIYNELKLNQKYKEEEENILKVLQEKVDNRMFKLEKELNKINQSINHVCQTKFEKYFAKMEQRLEITEGIVHASRIENSKYAKDLIQASTSLKIQWDKLENIKNEIFEKFNEELDIFKKLVDSTNRNYYNQDNEFKIFKQRFTQLADYLKDFRNQKNKYKEMSNNIDFTKSQKFDKNYDLENYNKIGDDVKIYIKSPSPKRIRGKYTLNENENRPNRKESFSTTSTKKDNQRNSSPQKPRRNSMFIKDKGITIENKKIEKPKIMEKRMTNFNIKTGIKTNIIKDNIKNNNDKIRTLTFQKNDNNKEKLLNEIGLKTENKKAGKKKFFKIIKKQKTIVTENNIDLNFESKKNNFDKIKEKNSSKEEESEEEKLLSVDSESSDFSFSSMMISLHNIGQMKEIKNINKKAEKNKEEIKEGEITIDKEGEKEKINKQSTNHIEIYTQEKNSKEKMNNKDNLNIKEEKSKEKINEKKNIEKNIEKNEGKKQRLNEKTESSEKEKGEEKENIAEKSKQKIIQNTSETYKNNNKELINNDEKMKSNENKGEREKIKIKENENNKEIKKDFDIDKKIINLKENLIDNKCYKTINNFPKLNNVTKDNHIYNGNNNKKKNMI